jgi:outer membrane cobalamin receptor
VNTQNVTISGNVIDADGKPIPFATVELLNTSIKTTTSLEGTFILSLNEPAVYRLEVLATGYKTFLETLDVSSSSKSVTIFLQKDTEQLSEVVVKSASKLKLLNQQPLAISSLDFSSIQNSSQDALDILNRANGIRVRQTGGTGSDVNISIQGAQGNAIRRYYDGLPLKYLASGIDINNFPVNQIDRIDIYKGVTPLAVGTDALGGGIHIIPKTFYTSYLEANYQVGSFNTHKASVNIFTPNNNNVFLGSNMFLNYSDNTYKIDAQDFNEDTRQAENVIEVERFNNLYRSYYADVSVGLRKKPWADELKLNLAYTNTFKELQTGVLFNPVRPLGDVFAEDEGVSSTLSYNHSLLNNKLDIESKTNLGIYREKVTDSTSNYYNWFGEPLSIPNTLGAELFSEPSLLEVDKTILLQRLTGTFRINDKHSLTASNLYVHQYRKGKNILLDAESDVLRFPSKLHQNFSGLELKSHFLSKRIETLVTYKNYNYALRGTSITNAISNEFIEQKTTKNYNGGNVALKYTVSPKLFFRMSYENAYRLPEDTEVFGNNTTIRSNLNLKPEQSNNYNLGASLKTKVFNIPVSTEVNGFYRKQKDRILLLASGFDLAQYFNEEEVEIKGVDGFVAVKPFNNLHVNLSATYQDVRIQSALVAADNNLIGTRVPNLPSFFANVDVGYTWEKFLKEEDQLKLNYYYNYVEKFSSIREANALQNIANFVPAQHISSLESVYSGKREKYSIALRINNMFDDDAYDNFRVQRPGRSYTIKLRYVID